MKNLVLIAVLFSFTQLTQAQEIASSKEKLDSIYQSNIKKSRLYDVYIPKDLDDAHQRILKLTPPESIEKFKKAPEVEVCQKLHFGIGRWMIHNWNFYEGSRMSHYLKEKGILHPDDMAQFVLRTFHRKLTGKPLDEEPIIKELAVERKKEADYLLDK